MIGSKGRLKVTGMRPQDAGHFRGARGYLRLAILTKNSWPMPGPEEDALMAEAWKAGWKHLKQHWESCGLTLSHEKFPPLGRPLVGLLRQRVQNFRKEVAAAATTLVPHFFVELESAKTPEERRELALHLVNLPSAEYRFHHERIAAPGKKGQKGPFAHPILAAVVKTAYFSSPKSIGFNEFVFDGSIPVEACVLCLTAIAHAIRSYHSGVKTPSLNFTMADYSESHANLRRSLVSAIEKGLTPHGTEFLTVMYKNIIATSGHQQALDAPQRVDEYQEEEFSEVES
ncbi:hypothetical protein P7C70_g2973, partial [Phenoliferia sp. Uapishka_3]